MNVDGVAAWAGEHKALAIAATGGVLGLFALMAWNRSHVSGQSGATANDAGNTLIPYGDAESLGFAGLTDAITGLTTTLTPPSGTDPTSVGGNAAGGPWILTSPFANRIPITRTTPIGSRPSETTSTVTATAPKARYTARAGDTVKSVAARFHVTPTQFQVMNGLSAKISALVPGHSYRVGL